MKTRPRSTRETTPRARNVFRVAVFLFGASVIYSLAAFYLAFQEGAWQLFATAGIVVVLALVTVISIRLSARGRSDLGMGLTIGALLAAILVTSAVIADVGLVLGLTAVLMTTTMAGLTLPPKQASRAIIAGVVTGVAALLLDLFGPPAYRLVVPALQSLIPTLAGALILAYGFLAVRQFGNYSLRAKLITAFVVVGVLSVGAVAIVTDRVVRAELTQGVGGNLQVVARSQALGVSQELAKEISSLQAFGLSNLPLEQVQLMNAMYPSDLAAIQAELEALDQQWRVADAADNDADPLVQARLNNELASELREYRAAFPENVEVFVTDRYGALEGATNRTSDYYQADEAWWQAAYNNGEGGIYIGQPEFDESSQTLGLIIAVPLREPVTQAVVGVLRTTYDLEYLKGVLVAGRFGNSGHVHISLPGGSEIHLQIEPELRLKIAPARLNIDELVQSAAPYLETRLYSGAQHIASQALVTTGSEDGLSETGAIANLGWRVVAHQERREALGPVEDAARVAQLAGLGALLVSGLLAVSVAQVLAGPITRLTAVAEKVAAGDLSAQARAETGDEIGTLATTFNSMTARLRILIDSLELQVTTRTAQLQASADVGRAVASILDLVQLLREVVDLITDRFGFYYAAVFTLDEAGKFAVLRAATGEAGQALLMGGHKLEVGGPSMVGTVTVTRKPRVALDVGREAIRFANPLLPYTRSEIALPLVVGDRLLGALDVQSTQEAAFDETSAAVLQSMADEIAIALNNAALYAESQRNVDALNRLLEMSRDIASSRTLDDLRARALKHIQSVIGIDNYYVALTDEAQTEIRFIVQVRPDLGSVDVITRPFGTGRTEYVIRMRQVLRMNAAEARMRLAQLGLKTWEQQPSAFLGVPIVVGERVLGMIGLQNFDADAAFSELQERLTIALASQIGVTLDNLRLTEETQRAIAELDAANRRLTSQAWQRYASSAAVVSGEWRSGQWVSIKDEGGTLRVKDEVQPPTPQSGAQAASNLQPPTSNLQLPIRVRGQTIGEFDLARVGEWPDWTPEDIAFAQSLVDQVGQTIETARLLEETERLAGRERIINDINSRVRRTVNLDSILKTAVNELGRSLGAARVFARIGGLSTTIGDDDRSVEGMGKGGDHV